MDEGRLPIANDAEQPDEAGQGLLASQRDPRARHGGSVLMAAMLGLADAMGHDREPVEVVEAASDDRGEDLLLDFGGLKALDWRNDS